MTKRSFLLFGLPFAERPANTNWFSPDYCVINYSISRFLVQEESVVKFIAIFGLLGTEELVYPS